MANMPSISMSDYYGGYQDFVPEVPSDHIDLSSLPPLPDVGFADDWSAYDRSVKPNSIPTVPKPDPDSFPGLPDLESSTLPHHLWYSGYASPAPMASFPPNPATLQISQPPTPAAECQVSSTMSPVSPFSPNSDVSFEDHNPDGSPLNFPQQHLHSYEVQTETSLGDLNLKGLTEEQLVSLSARDLNRLCRDMPEDLIKQLKKRRRTLKNRGYAYNSRVRRVSQKNVLEKERDDLQQQLHQLTERCRLLERERDQWKRRAQSLEKTEV